MERVPALFAGTVFAVFGAALLCWTAARLRARRPVTDAGSTAATVMSISFGAAALLTGVWCLTQV
ncbi:hypothetical protein [Streptomyces sp. CBMA29]|uniref:hypothetical protein n=1 Tax=Streptomyces sp. CBMA29 TaxID=1896314 RepID=UPI001661FC97|nr:hypothetical protein [Streptomyces sp. CBMA29]MBD0737931.1 hypothetical protein [Streptomyces sp. CBMA29]